jgi:hypothetical protein
LARGDREWPLNEAQTPSIGIKTNIVRRRGVGRRSAPRGDAHTQGRVNPNQGVLNLTRRVLNPQPGVWGCTFKSRANAVVSTVSDAAPI